MEIEAKYSLPDTATHARLLALTALGGCELRPGATKQYTDHYYDTADRAIFRAGYALRLRDGGDHWRATLKGLGAAEGALHQREEVEADISPGALPAAHQRGVCQPPAAKMNACWPDPFRRRIQNNTPTTPAPRIAQPNAARSLCLDTSAPRLSFLLMFAAPADSNHSGSDRGACLNRPACGRPSGM